MYRSLLFIIALILLFSCDERKAGPNKFSDPALIKIYDFQDRRLTDSLLQYLDSEYPEQRKASALALGSVQDSMAAEPLSNLLTDNDRSVRRAAVFALGQTPGKKGFGFLSKVSADTTLADLLSEALGKTYFKGAQLPANLSSWGYYRLGLNGHADSTHVARVIYFLGADRTENERLGAVHFLSRGPAKIALAEAALITAVNEDNSADVRMAAVLALRKIKNDSSLAVIKRAFENDPDYRVRVNAVRALQQFPFEKTKSTLLEAVNDPHEAIAIAASEAVRTVIDEKRSLEIANAAGSTSNWRVQANLYQAALSRDPATAVVNEVKTTYQKSLNPYQKAALLSALQEAPDAWTFIRDEFLKADTPVVLSSAASALVAINRKKTFNKNLTKDFARIYIDAIKGGDPAVISTVADALSDSTLGYRAVIRDHSFLKEARKNLSLPRDVEVVAPLEAAIAYFEKRKNTFVTTNEFNHPIDWEFVKTIPSDQRLVIKTTRGNITIRLLVDEAPGSVANFLDLVKQDYFDNKFFHRVVPNFVIQAGCKRGDGSGSEDYSIRSEFSGRKYTTGSVGMASAGKDTEGTQWFITHSPTPHLDGRYTIFAIVEKGIEVVHQVQVGDKILDVEILK